MIHVELGEEIKRRGIWRYRVPQYSIEGRSRQPLLDACRAVKRVDEAASSQQIGLYREGRDNPDMSCSVEWGADRTVDETTTRFVKWKPFRMASQTASGKYPC